MLTAPTPLPRAPGSATHSVPTPAECPERRWSCSNQPRHSPALQSTCGRRRGDGRTRMRCQETEHRVASIQPWEPFPGLRRQMERAASLWKSWLHQPTWREPGYEIAYGSTLPGVQQSYKIFISRPPWFNRFAATGRLSYCDWTPNDAVGNV